ncbi:Protein argonaute-2 [Trichinella nelsoni]|uniref:Protein argonaute-2 n=1 Tax=Trichinella nelsoni TaxID=6336 RepID=A0A0V0REG3_9BILA|nr:Protein argonaute-2 [Trichinella nelsoni]
MNLFERLLIAKSLDSSGMEYVESLVAKLFFSVFWRFRSQAAEWMHDFSLVVVQKRQHARFLCCDEGVARGQGKNIHAGTVIDRVVTSPNEYDFFLCSHHGNQQATSRPGLLPEYTSKECRSTLDWS